MLTDRRISAALPDESERVARQERRKLHDLRLRGKGPTNPSESPDKRGVHFMTCAYGARADESERVARQERRKL
eukprot:12689466-Alexandrium_andersonii.AAC.1